MESIPKVDGSTVHRHGIRFRVSNIEQADGAFSLMLVST